MSKLRDVLPQRTPPVAALERDAALDRVSRVRRRMIVGAGALSALGAAIVATTAPGRTIRPSTGALTTSSSSSSAALPPLATPAQLGLEGPNQPPAAASSPSSGPSGAGSSAAAPTAPSGAVVSGGS